MTSPTTIVWYIVFCVVILLCLVLNFKVIHTLIVSLPERIRRQGLINKLIFQLSLISIGNLAVLVTDASDRVGSINLNGYAVGLLMGFLRTTLPCAFCTNMAAITFERVHKIWDDYGPIIVSRLHKMVWFTPITYGILSSLICAYTGKDNSEKDDIYNSTELANNSLEELRAGSNYATLINDGTRMLIFHFGVSGYMAYEFFKIWTKYTFPTFTEDSIERYEGTLRSIRFMCCHLVSFVSFTILMTILFLIQLIVQLGQTSGEDDNETKTESLLNDWSDLILMIYLTVNSYLNLYFVDTNRHLLPKWWCYQYCGAEMDANEMPELEQSTMEPEKPRTIIMEVMQLGDIPSSVSTRIVPTKQEERVDEQPVERTDVEVHGENEGRYWAAMYSEGEVKVDFVERGFRETMI